MASLLRRVLHPTPPPEHPDFGRPVARTRSGKPFRLLLIGGDIGALSQARSFYEAYGVPASLVSRAVTPYHTRSSLFHLRYALNCGRLLGLSPTNEEIEMSKKGRKRRDRRKNRANHGKRPNA